jgi:hydrogenase expression/formation protein HypC
MCIGLPLVVTQAWPGGAAVEGRGGPQRIDTRLVGDCAPGEWLLVFQGAARERLTPERAAEVDAALALLDAALHGDAEGAAADPGFLMPSQLSAADLARQFGGGR